MRQQLEALVSQALRRQSQTSLHQVRQRRIVLGCARYQIGPWLVGVPGQRQFDLVEVPQMTLEGGLGQLRGAFVARRQDDAATRLAVLPYWPSGDGGNGADVQRQRDDRPECESHTGNACASLQAAGRISRTPC